MHYAPPPAYPPALPPVSTAFEPPAAPVLTALAGERRVSLDWSDSAGASRYTVYRSLSATGPFLRVERTGSDSQVDSGLKAGLTYHYVVTAMDGNGNESIFSNTVSAQPTGIPFPDKR
jgi:fibronectin type 3 domain-containing protein